MSDDSVPAALLHIEYETGSPSRIREVGVARELRRRSQTRITIPQSQDAIAVPSLRYTLVNFRWQPKPAKELIYPSGYLFLGHRSELDTIALEPL